MNNKFDAIIESVKKYTLDSLVEVAFDLGQKNISQYPTSTILAFFEIVYRETDNNQFKYNATESVYCEICQQIFTLMNNHALSDFKKHNPTRFFQVLAYQQFPYQQILSEDYIQMQYFLFNADNENSSLNTEFKNKNGVSIKDYLDFANSLGTHSSDTNVGKTSDQILKIWTIDHDKVKDELIRFSNGVNNDFYKTFIPEFFLFHPFIRFKRIRCIDPLLLRRVTSEFLFLHVLNFSKNKDSFDDRFQKYVEKGLIETGIPYQSDDDLKTQGQLECDFLISDFLFVECKAIRLKPLAQINPTDNILKNNLTDIIKAYKQIIATANRCQYEENPYGVIISYQPFYFSDGSDICDILRDTIAVFLKENGFDLLVKPENLFFIDVMSWGKLIDVVKKCGINEMRVIFENAKLCNSSGDKKFEFSMHLKKYE